MRFRNKDYLKAFPRENKPVPVKGPEGPGSVTEEADRQEENKKDPAPAPVEPPREDQKGDDLIDKEIIKEGSD